MFHKNVNVELVVKEAKPEAAGYFSVVFNRPRNFTFDAGDWMDITFPKIDLRGGKIYSFSSSPTEQDIVITLREGVSPFKKALATVQSGDRLRITQYGNAYNFHLRDNRSSVLIAGGVGIAPFRSMLKEMYDRGGKNTVQLVYLNQSEDFLFRQELEEWQKTLPNIEITFIVTKDRKRKDREKVLRASFADINQEYYIAGPAGMVTSTNTMLEEAGVHKSNIKLDSFDGY
jgi:ferredoxin-NADP reductase